MTRWGLAVMMVALPQASLTVSAQNYQNAVKRLQPTYYYELNETTTAGGAVDSMGNAAAPGVYNGDYVNGPCQVGIPGPLVVFKPDDPEGTPVPGLGENNVAHLSANSGHITLGDGNAYGANDMTVAVFIKAGDGAQGGDRVFTNNLSDGTKSFQINIGNNGLVLAVDPSAAGANAERTLYMEGAAGHDRRLLQSASGWFHVVASTFGRTGAERASNFKIFVNGVNRTSDLQPDSTGWGWDTGMAKIGGRRANATDTTTHSGGQDEVAIWLNRVLTDEEVQSLWNAAITTEPERVVINEIATVNNEFVIKWESKSGKLYSLRSETDLAAATPFDWPIFGGHMDLVATPPENSLTIPLPGDAQRYFVIEESNAPPVEIYSEGFESGEGGWTSGVDDAHGLTLWQLGAPGAPGPATAHGGGNCFGTNLTAAYASETNIWLRSPAIDLTTAGGATLRFFQFVDIEDTFDWGRLAVLDASDDSELTVLDDSIDGITTDWEQAFYVLPAEALGKNVKFEFRFESDDFNTNPQAGWYLDDITVTVP